METPEFRLSERELANILLILGTHSSGVPQIAINLETQARQIAEFRNRITGGRRIFTKQEVINAILDHPAVRDHERVRSQPIILELLSHPKKVRRKFSSGGKKPAGRGRGRPQRRMRG